MSNSSFGFHSKKKDMREYVGMVILDLQKAFDTVNHKIIINKLKALGLNQIAINWFVSYLRDREQIVDINSVGLELHHCLYPGMS